MFKTILIANRGEIACRVMRTARRLGIRCIAVYSDADREAQHVAEANEAYRIGPAPAAESYLSIDAIIAAAKRSSAEAIHPGYGFLSERAEFADACEAAGITFIGPPAAAMRAMGLKDTAKQLVQKAGVPVVPGYHGGIEDLKFLAERAREIGYPIIVKAVAGGGGKGMRRVDDPVELAVAIETAAREARASFGNGRILIEKFIHKARHLEIQVFADSHGNAVSLFERDCSLQRRHQKVIEEAPAPGMPEDMRRAMGEAAVNAAREVGYRGAGTVEFLADVSKGLSFDKFYFMEMNTRLQVEHPVTEAITGLDLVEWQLRVATGERLPKTQDQMSIDGHSFEARIYAEDPERQFLPSTGRLTHLQLPRDARVDSGVREGDEITPYYDPLIAKLIVHGRNREAALAKLEKALGETSVMGCTTNIAFLKVLSQHPEVVSGNIDTGLIERELQSLNQQPYPSDAAIVIAAIECLNFLRQNLDGDPWGSLTGWRAWGESHSFFRIAWRDQPIEGSVVPLERRAFRVELPERTFSCSIVSREGEPLRFDFADQIIGATVVRRGRQIDVSIDCDMHTFTVSAPAFAEANERSVTGRLVSPITGVVSVVKCKTGDRVAKGYVLLVIEAMKLEHAVAAGNAGTVAEIYVKAGDHVHEKTELLRFADDPS